MMIDIWCFFSLSKTDVKSSVDQAYKLVTKGSIKNYFGSFSRILHQLAGHW